MIKRAFTLLEVMLVMLLIAMATSFVVPTLVRPSASPAQHAAEHFYGLLGQLRDTAQIDGRVTGVWANTQRYHLLQRIGGQWQPAALPHAATDVTVPPGVQLILLQEVEQPTQRSNTLVPQVWFSLHEPVSPFRLQFRQTAPRACWEVIMQATGAMTLHRCAEVRA